MSQDLRLMHEVSLDHLPDSHLAGIGLVAVSWAFLEGTVERIIWRCAGLSDMRGQAVTTHMSLPMRLDAMCSLANLEFPDSDANERLPKIAKTIKGTLSPLRGEIVHSRILVLGDFGAVVRPTYKARGKVKSIAKAPLISEYEDTSRQILKTTNELIQIHNGLVKLIADRIDALSPSTGTLDPLG